MTFLPNGLLSTSQVGVGCAYLTEGFGMEEARVIDAAYEAGARHFDVAPQYGMGTAEKVLGFALREKRRYVTIASKVGILRPRTKKTKLLARTIAAPFRKLIKLHRSVGAVNKSRSETNFSPEYVTLSLNESLKTIKTDYLDVYLLHMVTLEQINDDLLKVLTDRRQSGEIRCFGLATDRAEADKIISAFPDVFDIVQYSWSVLDHPLSLGSRLPFLITHRSILRAHAPLKNWFERDMSVCRRLSDTVGVDLSDENQLCSALIAAAVAANPGGIGLVASRSPSRIASNVVAASDNNWQIIGSRFRDALISETARPYAME